jgi:hypothetical protein
VMQELYQFNSSIKSQAEVQDLKALEPFKLRYPLLLS